MLPKFRGFHRQNDPYTFGFKFEHPQMQMPQTYAILDILYCKPIMIGSSVYVAQDVNMWPCEASLASLFHVPPNSKPEYHTLSQHFIVSWAVFMLIVIRSWFIWVELWANHWGFKTLLPGVSFFACISKWEREVSRKRLPLYSYSMHSTPMAPPSHYQFNESTLWERVKKRACFIKNPFWNSGQSDCIHRLAGVVLGKFWTRT